MAEQETGSETPAVRMAYQLVALYFRSKGEPLPPELQPDLEHLNRTAGAALQQLGEGGPDWPDFSPGERKQAMLRSRQRIAQDGHQTVPTPGTAGNGSPGAGASAPGKPLLPWQIKQARLKGNKG